jgi:hypothetical protein
MVKYMCNVCVCVCHCIYISFFFIKNTFEVINYTRLKSTYGIGEIIGFRGAFFWLGVWLPYVIILATMVYLHY